MGYEKLDLILQKLENIEDRLQKLESETNEIHDQTTQLHSNIPFVDWLKTVAENVTYRLGYDYPENLAIKNN